MKPSAVLIVVGLAVASAGAGAAGSAAELARTLDEAARRYDVDAVARVQSEARTLYRQQPSEAAADLLVRSSLEVAELLRIEFEEWPEGDPEGRRIAGQRIDAAAEEALAVLSALPETSDNARRRADLVATMIRSDFRGKKYRDDFDRAVARALELDPRVPWALAILANSYEGVDHDWERAEDAWRKAYELQPEVGVNYGWLLAERGRVDEGLEVARRAIKSDPLNPWQLTNLGRCFHFARRYGEAVALFHKVLSLDKEFSYASEALTWSLFMQDKQADAFEAWNLQKHRLPADVLRAAWEKGGWEAVYAALLRDAEAAAARPGNVARLRLFHAIYTRSSDGIVGALETLEKGGDSWLAQLVDPLFDPARDNLRFKALLKRLRYPEPMWR